MFQVSQLAEAEPGLKVCLGASGSEGHTLVSVPRCLWRDRHNPGVSGQTLPPTPQCGAGPEFFPREKAPVRSEGPPAVPTFQGKRASLPLLGVGRAGSNFPTMCKLVNLRVCKRGPLKGP